MRVAGTERFNLRIIEYSLIHVLAGPNRGLAGHDLGDELLLVFQHLPEITVESPFCDIPENLHLGVMVALAEDPSFLLFQVGRFPGTVQMVESDQLILHVGAGSQFGSRTKKDTHLAGAYFGKEFGLPCLRIRLMDEDDFFFRDSHGDKLVPDIIVDIEAPVRFRR